MAESQGQLIYTLQAALEGFEEPIACAYLYGSRARGTARPDSDIDLAVLFARPQPPTLLGPLVDCRALLEAATGLDVDLIDIETAPVDLVHRILRDGRLLIEADPQRRITFEVDARNRYFDLLPYLREYRRGTTA